MTIPFPTVELISFQRPFSSGANKPWLVTCKTQNGDRAEYVLKFHTTLNRAVIREYAASFLATALKLKNPPATAVIVPPEMASTRTDPDLQSALSKLQNPNWGTLYFEGYQEFHEDIYIPKDRLEEVVKLFAFDMLIQNQDRTVMGKQHGNPNMLVNGDEYVLIDHDKTFLCTDPIAKLMLPPPWELRREQFPHKHLFYQKIRQWAEGFPIDFNPFLEEYSKIPDTALTQMFEQMPESWRNDEYEADILKHLFLVKQNLDKFSDELLEVLA